MLSLLDQFFFFQVALKQIGSKKELDDDLTGVEPFSQM